MNYYNDNDPKVCAWLRELIAAGLIPKGDVDERSITDVQFAELRGYQQCHFFAGIGGWPFALQLAGWPEDRQVWTGSCPCQPLSCAGLRKGHSDSRHLWPAFYRLISECKPATVFGEQVASKDGCEWLAGIRVDLEGMGYAVGASDLCAAGCGAPHKRQRLFWVANATGGQREQCGRPQGNGLQRPAECSTDDSLANNQCAGLEGRQEQPAREECEAAERSGRTGGMGDTKCTTGSRTGQHPNLYWSGGITEQSRPGSAGSNFWSDSTTILCRDGKTRRVKPGIFPLAYGLPGRVGLLRGAGNAVVPQVAAEFIRAAVEAMTTPTTIPRPARPLAQDKPEG